MELSNFLYHYFGACFSLCKVFSACKQDFLFLVLRTLPADPNISSSKSLWSNAVFTSSYSEMRVFISHYSQYRSIVMFFIMGRKSMNNQYEIFIHSLWWQLWPYGACFHARRLLPFIKYVQLLCNTFFPVGNLVSSHVWLYSWNSIWSFMVDSLLLEFSFCKTSL